jgi:hypothetical protein
MFITLMRLTILTLAWTLGGIAILSTLGLWHR